RAGGPRRSWHGHPPVGEALAVRASTLISIGRIGCCFAGCCTGVEYHPRMRWRCVRYPPGTEAFNSQVGAGVPRSGELPLAPGSRPLVVLRRGLAGDSHILFYSLGGGRLPGATRGVLLTVVALPHWLREVSLDGLRVGRACVNLRFWREGDRSRWVA